MSSKKEIIRSWYANETLSDDEVNIIYSRLLELFLLLYESHSNDLSNT